MRKILSLFIAITMLMSLVPTFASANDAEFTSVTVDFTKAKVKGTAPYGVSEITGTGFSAVVEESTVYESNQTRILTPGLQVAVEKQLYFSATANHPTPPIAQFTIMVDMGENAKAGLYDIAFTGASWYPASNLHIFADGRYIGDYTAICTDSTDLTVGEEAVYKSVYLEPDENGQVKFMFAVAKLGHNLSTGGDGNQYVNTNSTYGEGRILLNKLVISKSTEPAVQETVELNLSRAKMGFIDNKVVTAADSNLKIIEKYEIVAEKSPTGVSRCYDSSNLVQIQTRSGAYSRWPVGKSQNDMYTIETVVPKAGFYSVHMQGYKSYAGSDYAIYVNGEYAGDYSCWNGYTTNEVETALGDLKQLNTIELPRGNVEISFRPRKAHYNTPNLYPYKIQFVPAEKPVAEAIETKFIHPEAGAMDITPELAENFEVGTVADFTARVKMTDGTYRSFGYTDAGYASTADVIKVTSTNPDVVAVSDVVCVEAAYASAATITQKIDPTTTKFKLTAVKPGSAEIVVTAVIDGKEEKIARTAVTVPDNAPGEAVADTVKVYIDTTTGGSVAADKVTVKEVADAKIGETIKATATANEGYKFAYWKDSMGNVVSESEEYTFKAFTNTSIIAVFDNVSEENATYGVEFFDGNRDYLGFVAATKGDLFESLKEIPTPSLTGYKFKGWSIAENTVINAVLRAVALYEEIGNPVSGVKVNNSPVSDTKYDDEIKKTVEGAKAWYRDNKLVGYGDTYTYYVWGNTEITSSEEAVEEKLPLAVLNTSNDAYMLEYDNAGYKIVDAGILFGNDTHKEVNSCYYKAKVKNIKAHGQFTAKKSADEKYDQTVVRGYVMFEDTDGTIRVIYAD